MKKVSVIGLGYVGLPLAIAIAESRKHKLIGFDINEQAIESIKNKACPFGDSSVDSKLQEIELDVSSDPSVLTDSDIYLVCVPTPVKNDYQPNLDPLKNAIKTACSSLKKGNYLIVESTINPGVCDEIVAPLVESETGLKAGQDYALAHCPERINPGDKKWNVYNIPRNIGASSKTAAEELANFYRSFLSSEINVVSNLKVAEATKIVENTFRDINIAYVNELAKSFDKLNIDLVETIDAASNKPFAFMAHYPSCGVGGHCIPVDPYYLIERAGKSGFDHKFLKMAREVNRSMPKYTVGILVKALNSCGKALSQSNILLYGLSYKANVGDLRESPAIVMKNLIEKWDANLKSYDPYIPSHSDFDQLEEALAFADAVVIACDHDQIKEADLNNYENICVVIDGKNCLNKSQLNESVTYRGIGAAHSELVVRF